MVDERTTQIMKRILEFSFVSKDELIKSCSLTKRQLDYGLEKINEWLKQNNLMPVRFVNNHLSIQSETYKFLLNTIHLGESAILENYILSKHERAKYIFFILLTRKEFLSFNHFIDVLEVSKSTIMKDFKAVEEFLENYDIQINYSRKQGYYLSGEEGMIRYVLMKLVMECVSLENNRKLLDLFIKKNQLDSFDEMLEKVVSLSRKHQISFVENRLIEFVYTFILMKQRLVIDPTYLVGEITVTDWKQSNEYLFTKELIIEGENLSEQTVDYVYTWLLGVTGADINQKIKSYEEISKIVEDILVRFEFLSGIVFENRDIVKKQILLHFKSVHYRLMFKIPILNPLCYRIKEEYRDLFILVKETMKYYEWQFNVHLPDDEIAYLVTHFASLIEKFKEENKKRITAVVVCPSGLGSSMIMYTQLKSLFPEFSFLEPISNLELKMVLTKVDIIFSTTSNVQLLDAKQPCFVVSPIMTIAEKHRLLRDVYMEVSHFLFKVPSINQIMDIVSKYVDADKRDAIEKEVFQSILAIDSMGENNCKAPYLHEIIKKSFVQLDIVAKDKYEAVRLAAQPLLEEDFITIQYVEKMIETLQKDSKYMAITKHVALPHTKIEFGSKGLAVGVTVLKTPIIFDNKDNDPVKYIFCLSMVDKENHLQALSSLVNLLSSTEFYEVLEYANQAEEIIEYIKCWEYTENLSKNKLLNY